MTIAFHILLQAALILRVLLRPHRDPASRIAWIVVILGLPVIGMVGYILLGETNIGRRRIARLRQVVAALPDPGRAPEQAEPGPEALPPRVLPLFRVGTSISGYRPLGGNAAALMADSDATVDALVADIAQATKHVHLLFYIWLPDRNGARVAQALAEAAARRLVRSPHWAAMEKAGVRLARALPVGNPFLRALMGRIDLRNHRKIAVVDGRIAYCGSQNCADPEFLIKAKYAPWVDIMLRVEGPVVWQCQHLFASDWMTYGGDDLAALLREPLPPASGTMPAQVVASGPTVRHSAMPEMFQSLMYAARHELVVTTPYYVPDESMQAALCAAAFRGVATTIVFPARNDNVAVGAASRSYYADLLAAGVRIFEFKPGLLHAKTIAVDGEAALVGSANMDRRSFDLNYENNLLLFDAATTRAIRDRQDSWIAQSREVLREEVAAWSPARRVVNNAAAVLGPVL
jgi:cardiolipin synthase